jgi:hypothetical protein
MADIQGSVVFAINGEKHCISASNWAPGMTLNEYIRRHTPYKVGVGGWRCGCLLVWVVCGWMGLKICASLPVHLAVGVCVFARVCVCACVCVCVGVGVCSRCV